MAKRTRTVTLKLTEQEHEILTTLADKQGRSVSNMMRRMMFDFEKTAHVVNDNSAEAVKHLANLTEEVNNFTKSNNGLGNNLNQLVKKVNAGELEQLATLKKDLVKILNVNNRINNEVRKKVDDVWRHFK